MNRKPLKKFLENKKLKTFEILIEINNSLSVSFLNCSRIDFVSSELSLTSIFRVIILIIKLTHCINLFSYFEPLY